jgi:hypothetical protein
MSATKPSIDQDTARQLFIYDEQTGVLTWRNNAGRRGRAGAQAGCLTEGGYRKVRFLRRGYLVHRVIWLYVTGSWPDCIDHINGIRDDNRIVNLRSVPEVVNKHNRWVPSRQNKSGFLGVRARKNGRYVAVIGVGGKDVYLGIFGTAQDAHAAYLTAKSKLHYGTGEAP